MPHTPLIPEAFYFPESFCLSLISLSSSTQTYSHSRILSIILWRSIIALTMQVAPLHSTYVSYFHSIHYYLQRALRTLQLLATPSRNSRVLLPRNCSPTTLRSFPYASLLALTQTRSLSRYFSIITSLLSPLQCILSATCFNYTSIEIVPLLLIC